jgi:IclR family transcriptional regulator, acetate operon repressor
MATDGVQSLGRAFDLMELLAEDGSGLTLSALAAGSGLPAPTIHRLMATLVQRGYARRLPTRRYALGPRLIHLGERASRVLAAVALPYLTDLVDKIGETANLAVLDDDRVVYAAQAPSRHSMRMFTEVGRRVRLHCTGVGKVLLAQLPPDVARELIVRGGMPPQTARTVVDPDELLAQLPLIATQGFAVDDGEQEAGVRCIAVPVPGAPAEVAMSVSGPEGRLPMDSIPRLVPLLRTAAAGLAADLRGDAAE